MGYVGLDLFFLTFNDVSLSALDIRLVILDLGPVSLELGQFGPNLGCILELYSQHLTCYLSNIVYCS